MWLEEVVMGWGDYPQGLYSILLALLSLFLSYHAVSCFPPPCPSAHLSQPHSAYITTQLICIGELIHWLSYNFHNLISPPLNILALPHTWALRDTSYLNHNMPYVFFIKSFVEHVWILMWPNLAILLDKSCLFFLF